MKKRGQVTLFIILGILIVTGIIAVILFSVGKLEIQFSPEESFQKDFDNCIYIELENQVDKLYENAGFLEKRELYYSYFDKDYSYLCYSSKPYESCTNYYPSLEKQSINELKNLTRPLIEQCFETVTSDYENQGYEIKQDSLEFDISYLPEVVSFKIKKEISLTKSNVTRSYRVFNYKLDSDIYDYIQITNRILNDESSYSFFDDSSYMLLYPVIKINKTKIEEITLYEISYRAKQNTFNFAVRRGSVI